MFLNRKHFEMIHVLATTDFRLKYHGSILGFLWTIVKPMMLFSVLYFVFSTIMRFPGTEHYSLYLLLGIILWTFFADTTTAGLNALTYKANLISKVYFPREVVVISSTLVNFMTFSLNMLIFFVFLVFVGLPFNFSMLLFPLYVLELYFCILGLSFILSVLYIKFKDLAHIWEILLQIGFWATPVVYPIVIIPEKYQFLLFYNPLTQFLSFSRSIFLDGTVFPLRAHIILFMGSVSLLLIGYFMFRKINPNIIEEL